jgi:hypothetical protein
VRQRLGHLVMIDVGERRDSWALPPTAAASDAYLLVEGSPRWFALLERNTAAIPRHRVRALLSDRAGEANAGFVSGRNASSRVRSACTSTPTTSSSGTAPRREPAQDRRRGLTSACCARAAAARDRTARCCSSTARLIAAMGGDDRTCSTCPRRGYGRLVLPAQSRLPARHGRRGRRSA